MLFILPHTWVLGLPQTLMYYVLHIKHYVLRLTPYTLSINPRPRSYSWGVFVLRTFSMTMKYYDQNLCPEALEGYQGYSLQAFTSGRIKLAFHHSHTDRVEYYADCPKRHREAYARQLKRSATAMPEHYAVTEQVLGSSPATLTYRVHLKRDNNATADNAHVILETEADTCHVVLNDLHHQWVFPPAVCQALLARSGPRKGAAACFNEYLQAYDHDWQDATFAPADYREGYRAPNKARANYVTDPSSEDDYLF